jgi:trans-L-3-hydroxyproline dehydratase
MAKVDPFEDFIRPLHGWKPPSHWPRITTIDAHAAGEPLRIIISGYPELPGQTILARRRYASEHFDYLRKILMWEPRGHADMYGCIITPPTSREANFGVLFLHNEGYSSMCGHGIIAVAKVAVETGLVPLTHPVTIVRIDSPAGLITAHAKISRASVESVAFRNVPSFVLALDEIIDVPGLGEVRYDLAFGGAFYAYVQAEQIGLKCTPEELPQLIEKGMAIKRAIAKSRTIPHPFEPDLSFLYGTIFIAPPTVPGVDSRNVCIFAEGEVDRSPTGTGVSGRMAIHFARKEIGLMQAMVIESIIGSRFTGRVVETTRFGNYDAVVPEVEGTAHITGRNEFLIDPEDPLRNGFLLR